MNQLPISPSIFVLLIITAAAMVALLYITKVPLSYNYRNLVVRWRMTLLTGLAFTLVIGLLTVMIAFVNGMAKLTDGSGYPENVIVLADGANDEAFSSLSFTDVSNIARKPGGTESYPASKELYVIAYMPIAPKEGRAPAQSIQGKIEKIVVEEGRFILSDAQGERRTLRLADNGKVFANSTEGKLENLRPGDNVWIAYEDKSGEAVATEIQGSNRRRFLQVRGIEDPEIAAQVHRLDILAGQWFGEAGVIDLPVTQKGQVPETAIQAVVGEGLARELGPEVKKPQLEVGDVFELSQRKWQVVGITKSEGTTYGSELWGKRDNIGKLYGKEHIVSSITIRTGSAAEASQFAEYLRTDFKDAKLQTQTELEYFDKLQATTQQFSYAIGFFTIFMAIGGIFGVMNTMFAAISQRTKDIGVLRILGYARRQILVSFLLESLVIALVGGLIGLAIGSLFHGLTATSVVSSGQGGFGKTVILRLIVDANTLAIGVVLTLGMGLIGGVLPALFAVVLKPLEALR